MANTDVEPSLGTDQTDQKNGDSIIGEKTDSCVPKFDALWFCYSPVHQMQEYYVYGTVDDCSSHWKEFYDCLKHKTRFKDPDVEAARIPTHPLWQLRTVAEAEEFWKAQFQFEGNDKKPGQNFV